MCCFKQYNIVSETRVYQNSDHGVDSTFFPIKYGKIIICCASNMIIEEHSLTIFYLQLIMVEYISSNICWK